MTCQTDPILSIIVPNYNHAAFLRQRLDSIFNQTFQNFELILLDDASTDDSIKILQEYQALYKNKVSHFIFNKKNSGSPFPQWKKGIALAKGEYIWIAESDDSAKITFLESAMSAFNKFSSLSAYISASEDLQGNEITQPEPFDKQYGYLTLNSAYFFSRCPIYNASSCVFKKENIITLKCLEDYQYIGDKVFWAQILDKKQVYFDCNFNNLTNTNNSSFSRSSRINPIKELKILKEHLNFLKSTYRKIGSSKELHRAVRKYNQKLKNRRYNLWAAPFLYLITWIGYNFLLLRIK